MANTNNTPAPTWITNAIPGTPTIPAEAWETAAEAYNTWQGNPDNPQHAYHMINTHPATWVHDGTTWATQSGIENSWYANIDGTYWMEVHVHHEEITNHNNTQEPQQYQEFAHDLRLDAMGETYEEALVNAAQLLDACYDQCGDERENAPEYPTDFDDPVLLAEQESLENNEEPNINHTDDTTESPDLSHIQLPTWLENYLPEPLPTVEFRYNPETQEYYTTSNELPDTHPAIGHHHTSPEETYKAVRNTGGEDREFQLTAHPTIHTHTGWCDGMLFAPNRQILFFLDDNWHHNLLKINYHAAQTTAHNYLNTPTEERTDLQAMNLIADNILTWHTQPGRWNIGAAPTLTTNLTTTYTPDGQIRQELIIGHATNPGNLQILTSTGNSYKTTIINIANQLINIWAENYKN